MLWSESLRWECRRYAGEGRYARSIEKIQVGDDLSFTATLKCEFDPAAKKADLAQGTTSEDNNDPKSEAVVVE